MTCAQDEFCSGTCADRHCGQFDYEWLDQTKCQNNLNPEPELTTTDLPFPTSTEETWIIVDSYR